MLEIVEALYKGLKYMLKGHTTYYKYYTLKYMISFLTNILLTQFTLISL